MDIPLDNSEPEVEGFSPGQSPLEIIAWLDFFFLKPLLVKNGKTSNTNQFARFIPAKSLFLQKHPLYPFL
jgi:hypothetical protein